jgi:aminoglycoside phosphotransferase (APT) family kinase protein
MDEITQKVLESVKAFLERLARTEAVGAEIITEAHMAATAISYQLARAGYGAAQLDRLQQVEQSLAGELQGALGKTAPGSVVRQSQPAWSAQIGAELTRVVQGAQTESGGQRLGVAAELDVAQRLRDFLVKYHEQADPTIGDGAQGTYKGGRGDALEDGASSPVVPLTADALQTWMREHVPACRTATVTEMKRLMGGFSKETYIVRLDADSADDQTIVIRKDGYGLPTGSSVATEFDVLEEVYRLGIPVPRPLWLERDASVFGTALMAVGFAQGQPAHLIVPADAPTRLKWAKTVAGALARLHRSTIRDDREVAQVLRADIAELQLRIEARERHPHPGIAFGLAWLTDHLCDLEARPVCRVHGDAGYHNMLMHEGELGALLDWEFSHYSDPVEDLVYIKPFIDQIDAWPAFLEIYEAESGLRYDTKAARFFEVWKSARNMVACLGSLNSLLLPGVRDVPLSVAGTVYIPKYEIEVLNSIIQGAQANV